MVEGREQEELEDITLSRRELTVIHLVSGGSRGKWSDLPLFDDRINWIHWYIG
jgi:accessory colonization factor AcfC